jgi:hypothetical protein
MHISQIDTVIKLWSWNRETESNDIPAGFRITLKDGRIKTVPLDTNNLEHSMILEWEAEEGNTIAES